jgi:hypothetical protein
MAMKQAGQIALMPFPYTNLANSKKVGMDRQCAEINR